MPWYGHGRRSGAKDLYGMQWHRACNTQHSKGKGAYPAPACHGCGSMIEHPCPECQGRGNVEQEESFTVTIPPGIEEGMALRIPGKGMASLEAGSASGDLFVVVRTRRDPRFERAGADLLRQHTISLTDAVLGTTLEVPTLDGSVSVTVPPGIQPGEVLRIRGKGLPEFGSAAAMASCICALMWRSRHILRVRNGIYTSVCVR